MAYKPKVLAVADGGTGVASNTAYAVLCGGTTSTGNIQSIAGVGSATQVLTSNGAGALPSFQAPPAGGTGYVINVGTLSNSPLNDSTTAYWSANQSWTSPDPLTISAVQYSLPFAGTITAVYGTVTVGGTLGSSENCTLRILLNGTSATDITTTLQLTSADNTFSNNGLSISVTAGDFINIEFIGPVFATNPSDVVSSISVLVT